MNLRLVTAHFPYLPIRVQVGQYTIDTEALLDTGFDGAIILPSALVANGVPAERYVRVVLADSSRVLAATYVGMLRTDGSEPPLQVGCLLGMGEEHSS